MPGSSPVTPTVPSRVGACQGILAFEAGTKEEGWRLVSKSGRVQVFSKASAADPSRMMCKGQQTLDPGVTLKLLEDQFIRVYNNNRMLPQSMRSSGVVPDAEAEALASPAFSCRPEPSSGMAEGRWTVRTMRVCAVFFALVVEARRTRYVATLERCNFDGRGWPWR